MRHIYVCLALICKNTGFHVDTRASSQVVLAVSVEEAYGLAMKSLLADYPADKGWTITMEWPAPIPNPMIQDYVNQSKSDD